MSRRSPGEIVNIDPHYLANIEKTGSLSSLPFFYQLVKISKFLIERYFFPGNAEQEDEEHERAAHKLELCPKVYLLIIETAIDGTIGIEGAKDA